MAAGISIGTMVQNLRIVSRVVSLCLIASVITAAVSYRQRMVLPQPEEIVPVLSNEPDQQEVNEPNFKLEYANRSYLLYPVADYSIYGLVVSHNDISAIDDIYHDSSSVDVRDLCVVWGENVATDIYRRLRFWSEPWTCFYYTDNRDDFREFNPDQLANNHLLPADLSVKRMIDKVRIGDQVLIEGKLVNYNAIDNPGFIRKTSLIRTDTGNGACEVLYVNGLRILAHGSKWHTVFEFSHSAVLILFFLKAFLWVILPYLEYKLT